MQEVIGREVLMSHEIVKIFQNCFPFCDLNEVKVWKELAVEYRKSVIVLHKISIPLSFYFSKMVSLSSIFKSCL